MCWSDVLEIVKIFNPIGLLIVGGIGAWIAIDQRIIAKRRLAADLLDKRFEVLKSTDDLYWKIIPKGTATTDDFRELRDIVIRSRALFSAELHNALSEICDQLDHHIGALRLLEHTSTQENVNELIAEKEETIAKVVDGLNACVDWLAREMKP
jgi:hypothetical protein